MQTPQKQGSLSNSVIQLRANTFKKRRKQNAAENTHNASFTRGGLVAQLFFIYEQNGFDLIFKKSCLSTLRSSHVTWNLEQYLERELSNWNTNSHNFKNLATLFKSFSC